MPAENAFRLPLQSDAAFQALNFVCVGWALLALAPRWQHTPKATLAIAAAYSALYAALVVEAALGGAGEQPEGAGFGSLAAVVALVSKERNVLAGWTHYIAYDLLVARGCVLDARTRGVPWIMVSLLMPLFLLAGPVGLVAYLALAALYPAAATARLKAE